MGKAFLIILLIGVAAFFIYRQVKPPLSGEELKVKALEDLFISASGKLMGAGGGPGVEGLDTAEAAAFQIQKVRANLADLRRLLTEDKAIRRAEDLKLKIDEFCRKNDIL
jgi:hypothetical protein